MSSAFERDFCGGEFWNENLTWNCDSPDFTPCFHKTVLSWTPTLVLALFSVTEFRQYTKSVNRDIPWNVYNLTKTLLTFFLIVLSITEIILATITDGDDIEATHVFPVDYVTSIVFLVTYIWSLVLLRLSMRYGIRTSPAQFLYYFSWIFTGGASLRSIAMRKSNGDSGYDPDATDRILILFSTQYALHVFLFILNCFSDCEPRKYDERIKNLQNPCPQLKASFLSKILYVWASPLLWKGFRRPLTTEDLWDMSPSVTSSGVVPDFDANLRPSVEKAKMKSSVVVNSLSEGSRKGTLTFKTDEDMRKAVSYSIFPAMIKTFGPTFFVGSAMKIIYDALSMIAPQLMKLMINFVEANVLASDSDEKEQPWKGYFYAGLLLASTMFQSLLLSQYFERMFVVGMNLRTALISAIYRKALRMTGAARKESTVGEIVNLMSVDVQRFMDLLPYLNMLWSAPFQIALCSYFMYEELGPSVFAGVAIMVLAIPLNGVIAGFSRKYQLQQMKSKDKRVKLMNEILGGVKVLKLYGWEPSFIEQVLDIREQEIKVLKKAAWLNAFVSFIWTSVPFMVALASFATYVLIDEANVLDAQKAFVTLSYLNIMRMPMAVLPFMIVGLVQANVSLGRVNKFMNNEELDENAVEHVADEKEPIKVENGTFRWSSDEPTVLEDINITVKKGSLTAVVGTVGAGKSSLISAMLGEMERRSGRVNVHGSVAYVPQQAWMQNATLKNNILFGKTQNLKKYEKIVDACALRSDLKILPGGDQTEIGEKGINLSGGQKQRVSLARAVYSDADLYLLDDPLSAVDSHVGKHIFDKVISHNGLLGKKTRLLVTHGITYLPKMDHIVVIKEGRVSEQGSYQELVERKGDFAQFLLEYMNEVEEDDDLVLDIKQQLEETLGKTEFERQVSIHKRQRQESVSSAGKVEEKAALVKSESIIEEEQEETRDKEPETGTNVKKEDQKAGTNLINQESVETGSVSIKVYLYYMRYLGVAGAVLGVATQLIYQGSSIGTNFWLNVWANNSLNDTCYPDCQDFYLGIYGAFGFFQAFGTMILSIVIAITTLNASKSMHKAMLERVLKSSMEFFDTTPLGRIVNRFAKDVDVCDNTLPMNLRQWLNTFANFLGTIILIIVLVPIFGVVVIPIAIVFFAIQKIYVSTSRQLKRLESVSRSPIYSHFGETLNGASTIRAFGLEQRFIVQSESLVDKNQVCYYPTIITNRWLAVNLEAIGNLITFAAALFAVMDADAMDPSEVGLIISYALNVTQVLNWLVRMTSDVETNIVAVERIKEYTEINNEADWRSASPPPESWPASGSLEFQNYGMRYREGLDLVLKSINAKIRGGEKVGIVGRTGAGKSSLTVALFRLVEPSNGTIKIDDIDVSKLGLHELRNKLTIIPQDPVLFSGTLRINLDPFGAHSDDAIWKALELAHLKTYATSLEAGLQHEVAEGGDNLSVGQRQLICLARALLRKTKILILDEATAAVDLETDDLIQATIRKEFQDCTVLTIAHRLNTIMDYDRIMVLDKGCIAEFDPPSTLLQAKSSIFYSMAKDAGLA